jgi:hypothetical protein
MKLLLLIPGLINGGFMLLDGIYVLLKGKYIGPEKPGPWANLFYGLNINVFKLGLLFIIFGILWLLWVYSLLTHQSWAYTLGLLVSVLTLWYLPFGTILSILVIIVLLFAKQKVGL